jgi:hypothetical protein
VASKRLIENLTAERDAARKEAASHAQLHDDALAGAGLFDGRDYSGRTPEEVAAGHADWWECYEEMAADLDGFLALARSGAPDAAVKAAGYDPARYRTLR